MSLGGNEVGVAHFSFPVSFKSGSARALMSEAFKENLFGHRKKSREPFN